MAAVEAEVEAGTALADAVADAACEAGLIERIVEAILFTSSISDLRYRHVGMFGQMIAMRFSDGDRERDRAVAVLAQGCIRHAQKVSR